MPPIEKVLIGVSKAQEYLRQLNLGFETKEHSASALHTLGSLKDFEDKVAKVVKMYAEEMGDRSGHHHKFCGKTQFASSKLAFEYLSLEELMKEVERQFGKMNLKPGLMEDLGFD